MLGSTLGWHVVASPALPKRRVLVIAYLYPPIANSGTRRSLAFVNHLPDMGWEPTVLTVADPPARICDDELADEVRKGTRVVRAPLASDAIARVLARLAPKAKQTRMAEALAWRLGALARVPDEAAPWFPLAVRRGVELHRELRFDMVYASGWPWTSFLVAAAVSRKTGCPFVLDYRDMWKPSGTHDWEVESRAQRLLNPWLERRAASAADAVVTVTQTLVETIQHDASVPQVHCITNGFEPSDFAPASAPATTKAESLVRVSYTGVWRPGYGLEDLYKAIAQLKARGVSLAGRLQVDAAGFAPGPAKAFGVDDVVLEHGPVPHEQALAFIMGATVLYLPVPSGFYAKASLPGKLFEYLGSGRPIVAMVPPDSEVARVLNDVGGSMRIEPGDIDRLASVLERLCAEQVGALFSPGRPERLRQYTRESTTRALADLFEQVLQRRSAAS